MAGRVSFGGKEVDLQVAISQLEEQLRETHEAVEQPIANQLNATLNEVLTGAASRPNFDLVNSIAAFDGEKPEAILHLFDSIEDVGELSHWGDNEKLRVAKLKVTGAALKFIRAEDQGRLATYADFKKSLIDRFSDKAPQHCYFQQLSVVQQRRGETIEAFADRVKALNEKTIRVTANPEVNAALREEADRRALDAFVRGLIGSIGEQTRLAFPTTMREAITKAIAIDHITRAGSVPSDKKVFQADVVTCYRCHQKGHVSRDCRVGSNNRPSEGNSITCWRCNRVGHRQRDCRQPLRNAPPAQNRQSGNGSGANGVADRTPRQ